jgi:hypothetical protein
LLDQARGEQTGGDVDEEVEDSVVDLDVLVDRIVHVIRLVLVGVPGVQVVLDPLAPQRGTDRVFRALPELGDGVGKEVLVAPLASPKRTRLKATRINGRRPEPFVAREERDHTDRATDARAPSPTPSRPHARPPGSIAVSDAPTEGDRRQRQPATVRRSPYRNGV